MKNLKKAYMIECYEYHNNFKMLAEELLGIHIWQGVEVVETDEIGAHNRMKELANKKQGYLWRIVPVWTEANGYNF